MKTADFMYELPEELIAQSPAERRDQSRLLVANPQTTRLEHTIFSRLPEYLSPGDCLVLNNTRVIPARLLGQIPPHNTLAEVLLLERLDTHRWEVIVRPGKKLRTGAVVEFIEGRLTCTVESVLPTGNRIVRFSFDGIWEQILDEAGTMPLPPYIQSRCDDPERYQTVYSKTPGSAAAPTAGLHFTPELLADLTQKGIHIAELTLHVGLGTFRPVKVEDIHSHVMHSERYELTQTAADTIHRARAAGGRIIAVGTTSCRVLETLAAPDGTLTAATGRTDIFIYPGYPFRCVDALITNFHLPESTLLMLISAFAGKEFILETYAEAIREKYRFFSFGDAMFLTGKKEMENQP